jgi:hypothetical protein
MQICMCSTLPRRSADPEVVDCEHKRLRRRIVTAMQIFMWCFTYDLERCLDWWSRFGAMRLIQPRHCHADLHVLLCTCPDKTDCRHHMIGRIITAMQDLHRAS